MDKRPGFRKRIALELFRSIRRNRAKLHELRTLFWECTLRCNASCRHCGSDCHVSAGMKDMPVEDFLKVIDDITPHVNPNKVLVILPEERLWCAKTSKPAEWNFTAGDIPGESFPTDC